MRQGVASPNSGCAMGMMTVEVGMMRALLKAALLPHHSSALLASSHVLFMIDMTVVASWR